MRARLLLVLAAAAGLGAAAPVWAQDRTPATEAVATEAISQIRSPYCPGLMLEVCPSQQAEFLRRAGGRNARSLPRTSSQNAAR